MKKVTTYCDRCGKETTTPPFMWVGNGEGFLILYDEKPHLKGKYRVSIRVEQRVSVTPCIEWEHPDLCRDCYRYLVGQALRDQIGTSVA